MLIDQFGANSLSYNAKRHTWRAGSAASGERLGTTAGLTAVGGLIDTNDLLRRRAVVGVRAY